MRECSIILTSSLAVAVDFAVMIPRIAPQQSYNKARAARQIFDSPLFAGVIAPAAKVPIGNGTAPVTVDVETLGKLCDGSPRLSIV